MLDNFVSKSTPGSLSTVVSPLRKSIMLKKLQQLKAILAYKNSENLGDIAILKSEFFGTKVSPTVASKLQPIVGYYPVIDLNQLS